MGIFFNIYKNTTRIQIFFALTCFMLYLILPLHSRKAPFNHLK
nr:MAG TPA: hypothetical protein [Caudoviricetes sp.]